MMSSMKLNKILSTLVISPLATFCNLLMLFFVLFPECTCNYLGTERSQCLSRDDCLCQRATGQCQCLPNVIGLTCDHCAPNYWNLASGRGCETCNCDPNNAYTSGCNEVPVSPHFSYS